MITARWSVPETERRDRPLVVLLHGHGLSESVGWELRYVLPPEVVVAAVRAPRSTSAGGFSWFDLDPAVGAAQADTAAAELLAWLDEHSPAASSVGLVGFSQGGAAAAQTLRADPDRFSYLAILGGFVIPGDHTRDADVAARRPPVLWSRGREDRRIPADLVLSTRTYLQRHSTLDERVYAGLAHGVSLPQLEDLRAFVAQHR